MVIKNILIHSSTVLGFLFISTAIIFGLAADELSVFNSFIFVPMLISLNAVIFSLLDEKMVDRFVA